MSTIYEPYDDVHEPCGCVRSDGGKSYVLCDEHSGSELASEVERLKDRIKYGTVCMACGKPDCEHYFCTECHSNAVADLRKQRDEQADLLRRCKADLMGWQGQYAPSHVTCEIIGAIDAMLGEEDGG